MASGSPSLTRSLLAALADFDEPKRSTFVMFGVLTIAVRIYHDRWGYGVYSGPIGTATLIIAAKWVGTFPSEPARRGHPPPATTPPRGVPAPPPAPPHPAWGVGRLDTWPLPTHRK